jgi:iron complex transport system ATP-binding protein
VNSQQMAPRNATPDTLAGWVENPVRLVVEQASYAYSASAAAAPNFTLGPVTFSARQREIVGVLGPNASGKSTLLGVLCGEAKPLSGRVELDGKPPADLPLRERAQRIAIVHQESNLLFPLHVWEYVLQGRYPYGRRLRFENEADCLMAEKALAQVGAQHLTDRRMDELSGGERQRAVLARALAQQPQLLLLDEPTRYLDIGGKVELMRRLRRLSEENRYTCVVVTHELNLAAEFFDAIVLLQAGKCVAAGKPEDVYRRDLLEEVFKTSLEVEKSPSGRPRVILRGQEAAKNDSEKTEGEPEAENDFPDVVE